MRIRFLNLALFGLLFAVPATAQSCRTADSLSTDLLAEIKALMAAGNTVRTKLQLPSVDTSQITLVTDAGVCAAGLAALDSLVHATNPEAAANLPARDLYVVSIGDYKAVVDPNASAGEWLPIYFFDTLWAYVSVLIGWG